MAEGHTNLSYAFHDQKADEVIGGMVDSYFIGLRKEVEIDDISYAEGSGQQAVLGRVLANKRRIDPRRSGILRDELNMALAELIGEKGDPIEDSEARIDHALALAGRSQEVLHYAPVVGLSHRVSHAVAELVDGSLSQPVSMIVDVETPTEPPA